MYDYHSAELDQQEEAREHAHHRWLADGLITDIENLLDATVAILEDPKKAFMTPSHEWEEGRYLKALSNLKDPCEAGKHFVECTIWAQLKDCAVRECDADFDDIVSGAKEIGRDLYQEVLEGL